MADANEEKAARTVVAALDDARVKADCALITEAHAGHAPSGGFTRNLRPIGSSLLMRWPEFGYGISPHPDVERDDSGQCRWVEVRPWRGPREERDWPRELVWGTHEMDWPWIPATPFNKPARRSA
jgi:replicative DNA helicase